MKLSFLRILVKGLGMTPYPQTNLLKYPAKSKSPLNCFKVHGRGQLTMAATMLESVETPCALIIWPKYSTSGTAK